MEICSFKCDYCRKEVTDFVTNLSNYTKNVFVCYDSTLKSTKTLQFCPDCIKRFNINIDSKNIKVCRIGSLSISF